MIVYLPEPNKWPVGEWDDSSILYRWAVDAMRAAQVSIAGYARLMGRSRDYVRARLARYGYTIKDCRLIPKTTAEPTAAPPRETATPQELHTEVPTAAAPVEPTEPDKKNNTAPAYDRVPGINYGEDLHDYATMKPADQVAAWMTITYEGDGRFVWGERTMREVSRALARNVDNLTEFVQAVKNYRASLIAGGMWASAAVMDPWNFIRRPNGERPWLRYVGHDYRDSIPGPNPTRRRKRNPLAESNQFQEHGPPMEGVKKNTFTRLAATLRSKHPECAEILECSDEADLGDLIPLLCNATPPGSEWWEVHGNDREAELFCALPDMADGK